MQTVEMPMDVQTGNSELSPKSRITNSAVAGVLLFVGLFMVVNLLLRFVLLTKAINEIDFKVIKLMGVFACGTFFDLATACYFALPLTLYLCFCPARWLRHPWQSRILSAFYFVALYLLLFGAVAEWLFWDEFGSRFNFIAVDYLIYTTEVLGNIRESYPLFAILGILLVATAISFVSLYRCSFLSDWLKNLPIMPMSFRQRFQVFSPFLLGPFLLTLFVNARQIPNFGNIYYQELAGNGLYSFVAAFRNNELNFEQFYDHLEPEEAFAQVRKVITSNNATFLATNGFDLTRIISSSGEEKRWNVIQITVESLSAEFLGAFGNTNHLTPNLDRLAGQSLFFTNFFATGTRTVRGMEALTLSLPPSPGQSIVRRPNNENLFTLGSVFQERGYDTAFIYGGYGYFDNMNYFFGHNGYRVIDRTSVPSTNITFANVWGACDENVFDWSLDEADKAFSNNQPFFHFVMTTSNHRPFTYPDGRIDIPSHSGREGGVKYTDYAIGRFLEKAQKHPWFDNTLFVIVADHCASSAGKTDLPIRNYAIPLMIFQPSVIEPAKIGKLCSQIDYAPTLLGLMNWTYKSRFFGKDILQMQPDEERAFIATYQKLGLFNKDQLAVLQPVNHKNLYSYTSTDGSLTELKDDQRLTRDAIACYQSASFVFRNRLYQALHEP